MHVRALILTLAALAAFAPASASAVVTAEVRVLSCLAWQPGEGGSVSYEARMRAVPKTARMAVRFRLYEKTGEGQFRRVGAREPWHVSRSGVAAFVWEYKVRGLRQGATYFSVVSYRWIDARGEVIERARRRSAPCSQNGGLPNLRVADVTIKPGEVKDTAMYRATIVNRGETPARRVGVLLRVDGEVVDEVVVIDALQPGEERIVTFNGPVCRESIRVVVDPKDLITETQEQDNVRTPACV
jgi:hypothetical protein